MRKLNLIILDKNSKILKIRKQIRKFKLKRKNLEVDLDLNQRNKRKMMVAQATILNVMMNFLMICQLEILSLSILKSKLRCVLPKELQLVQKLLENIMLKVFLKPKSLKRLKNKKTQSELYFYKLLCLWLLTIKTWILLLMQCSHVKSNLVRM